VSADVTSDPRTPVLVGVGTAHRPTDGSAGVEPVDLMVEAAAAAAADAGAPGLLRSVTWVAVPEGNWTYPDPARLVADAIGATSAHTVRADIGVPQATPVDVAVERIAAGDLDVALVVGGEAMASRLRAQRAGGVPHETDQGDAAPDERWIPDGEIMAAAEIEAGIWGPVQQYACIDNALRHAEGRTVDEQLDEIADLWARCNAVAVANPDAAFPEPRTADFLRVPGPGNRPLAAPYAKWHSTQWSVDQAGALLLCTAAAARAAGVAPDRWVFPHLALESSHMLSMSRRAEVHRWPAMRVLGEAAAAHLGRRLDEVEHVECYSCFPAAVRVQQRELGLPLDGTPTLTGGMAFAGGPLNNFTYQATATMVPVLREHPGELGMITTVSGLLTKPGLTVWGARPPTAPAPVADLGERAAAATAGFDVTHDGSGTATVVTATVSAYDGDEPLGVFVVADLSDGRRWIGTAEDPDLARRVVTEDVIGTTVSVDGRTCTPT
jgi:acetyl-CoA C-acetyltransferase